MWVCLVGISWVWLFDWLIILFGWLVVFILGLCGYYCFGLGLVDDCVICCWIDVWFGLVWCVVCSVNSVVALIAVGWGCLLFY